MAIEYAFHTVPLSRMTSSREELRRSRALPPKPRNGLGKEARQCTVTFTVLENAPLLSHPFTVMRCVPSERFRELSTYLAEVWNLTTPSM